MYCPHWEVSSNTRDACVKMLVYLPRAEKPANKNNLAEVICIVIGDEKSFAKNGLSCAVRDSGEEINLWIRHQLLHRRQVPGKQFQAFLPLLRIRGFRAFWPVSGGPVGRGMFRVAREFEDVPLRNAHVLQQFP